MNFGDWCEIAAEIANDHDLNVLSSQDSKIGQACERIAAALPGHYALPARIAAILDKFSKDQAAAYVREKLPKSKQIRSGDLGEILATQYIDERTGYNAPIKRLRWKDHREMSMRGDDVIGIAPTQGNPPISFLKSEVKSRATLSPGVVEEARLALNRNSGLPSPHALAFVSDRLHGAGQDELADLIIAAQLQDGISQAHVQHLLFTFSGNAPNDYLKADLENYDGPIHQNAVGLYVNKHQEFVAAVYETVEAGDES